MFIPNNTCYIRRAGGVNRNGEKTFSPKESIRFGLVRFDLKVEDSTVRADSSATRGNVKEFHASGRILVPVSVKPNYGDIVIVEGRVFRIKEVEPRFNVLGFLDHYELDLARSEDKFGDES